MNRDSQLETATTQGTPAERAPILHLLTTLWKRRLTFVAVLVATIGAVAATTFALPKVYSSRALILVQPTESPGSDFAAVELTRTLGKTYAELLQGPAVAESVAEALPYEASPGELLASVEVSPVTDSQLLEIEAEEEDPVRAQALADTYAEVFVNRAEELASREAGGAELTVAEPASLPASAARPRPTLYLLVGSVAAVFLAAGAVLLRDRLSQRIEVDDASTTLFGLPVIARIPRSRPLALTLRQPETLAGHVLREPFRILRTNLSLATSSREPLSVAIVSSGRGEGKSLCAANLAAATAEFGSSTLLVDADLRLATLSQRVGADDSRRGLSTILAQADDVAALLDITLDVPGQHLSFLPAGPPPPNPAVLLGSETLRRLNRRAHQEFDFVIYDCPPMSVAADATLIAESMDGIVVVLDADRTRRNDVPHTLEQLRRARAKVLGVVINRAPGASAAPRDYYAGISTKESPESSNRTQTEGRAGLKVDGDSTEPPSRERRQGERLDERA